MIRTANGVYEGDFDKHVVKEPPVLVRPGVKVTQINGVLTARQQPLRWDRKFYQSQPEPYLTPI